MKKYTKSFLVLFFLISVLVLPFFVFAEDSSNSGILGNVDKVTENVYAPVSGDGSTLPRFIGTVIKAFFSILGLIFIVLMLYGGYKWMMAGGDESSIETAKKTISRAIIGLIITVGSYALWMFVFEVL